MWECNSCHRRVYENPHTIAELRTNLDATVSTLEEVKRQNDALKERLDAVREWAADKQREPNNQVGLCRALLDDVTALLAPSPDETKEPTDAD